MTARAADGSAEGKAAVLISQFTPQQKQILAILTLLNFLNYVDRQIAYALVPLIRVEFALSHFQVALL